MSSWVYNLRDAIVLQAVKDLRHSLKKLKKHPESRILQDQAAYDESFFRSRWYGHLTEIDGELIIEQVHRQVGI